MEESILEYGLQLQIVERIVDLCFQTDDMRPALFEYARSQSIEQLKDLYELQQVCLAMCHFIAERCKPVQNDMIHRAQKDPNGLRIFYEMLEGIDHWRRVHIYYSIFCNIVTEMCYLSVAKILNDQGIHNHKSLNGIRNQLETQMDTFGELIEPSFLDVTIGRVLGLPYNCN